MSKDRSQYTTGLDARAYAVKVNGQWFAGFGGGKGSEPTVKLRRHLADARLMVSPARCADYIARLSQRGLPGATWHVVEVAS